MAAADLPEDAKLIAHVLESMGVSEYEPRVIHQLMDLMYRYAADILLDADAYHERAGRPEGGIATEDVLLAIQGREAFTFVPPPPQDVLFEMADQINKKPLPEFAERPGLRIPNKDDSLTAQVYQYVSPNQLAAREQEGDTVMADAAAQPNAAGAAAQAQASMLQPGRAKDRVKGPSSSISTTGIKSN
ncbi:hypothetical protein WJX73_008143 [Symbiochloris irregularis]|uniref:Transcription initiation factor TFIID subunit 9 n=1 Tax=Symbiochloris irregularis TaxID=706552 RepID=A0AAW1PHI0_9CHLO